MAVAWLSLISLSNFLETFPATLAQITTKIGLWLPGSVIFMWIPKHNSSTDTGMFKLPRGVSTTAGLQTHLYNHITICNSGPPHHYHHGRRVPPTCHASAEASLRRVINTHFKFQQPTLKKIDPSYQIQSGPPIPPHFPQGVIRMFPFPRRFQTSDRMMSAAVGTGEKASHACSTAQRTMCTCKIKLHPGKNDTEVCHGEAQNTC